MKCKLSPQKIRILKYLISGIFSAILDISTLWALTEIAGIYYILSAVAGFVIGTTSFYVLGRVWVFRGTKTKFWNGYLSILLVAGVGVIFTIILMAFFVEILRIYYLFSRIITSFLVLIWTYNMNRYVTFKQPVAK